MPLNVFIFIGREGDSSLEQWVMGARVAAAGDLLRAVSGLPGVGRCVIATNAPVLTKARRDWPVTWDVDPTAETFHFGERLAALTAAYPADAFAYFGAGCAPLLPASAIASAVAAVQRATTPHAVTNNLLSSDWLVFNCADEICARTRRLGRDNMLAPVLKFEAQVNVDSLPAAAATRADIDTPADLFALSLHPHLSQFAPELAAYLDHQPAPVAMLALWRSAQGALSTPGGRITLIGRVSSAAWQYLEARTRCWTRVLSEERGMSASGRQAAGQVRSLVAAHLWRVGPEAFFAELGEMADAVFLDTRVALAHLQHWPEAADRYASDAGRPDLIGDERLQALTRAALNAPIPIVLGGHGVVTGDLYALLDSQTV
ncbi:MAG: hypothetical protein ACT4QE_24325 [Anaerolineales bacterium]